MGLTSKAAAVVECRQSGMKPVQIARKLDLKLSTVKSYLNKASLGDGQERRNRRMMERGSRQLAVAIQLMQGERQ